MTTPISLIITVYNQERYLTAAIESALAQTFRDFELLIWDDGSTDNSLDIARYYSQRDGRVKVVAAPHRGLAPSLKAAIAQTTGTYVGSIDSDDTLAPTTIEETAAVLDAYPSVGVVYTDHLITDENGVVKGLGQRCLIPYSSDRLLVDFMSFHFRLFRRSVYDLVGGFDESFERAEDYDLCLRLSEVTQFYHLNRPLYYHRRHPQNMTNQTVEQILWSQKAVSLALQRRGLAERYMLKVDLQQGHFCLYRKRQQSETVHPQIQ